MSTEALECRTCGDACADGVTVVEKDSPGQLIMMCDHTTVTFQLSEYDADSLPPDAELPDEWVREAAAES